MIERYSTPGFTALLVLGIMVIGSNSFLLSPILTDVAHALQTKPVVVARVISAYGAATAVSAFLFAGRIDRLGARPMLVTSAAVMAMALLGSAAGQSWQALALCQALAGLAAGVMLPAIYATAIAAAPPGQDAHLLGRVLNGWALSLVAGVPISALLTEHLDWRVTYLALAALAACAAAGFLRLPRATQTRPDEPLIAPVRAFRIPGVARLLIVCLCYMTAFYGTYAFLGDHVRHVTGVGAGTAGLVVLGYGTGFGLAGFLGRRVDRVGPARVFPGVLACLALIYLVMSPATATLAGAIGIATIWGMANHLGLNILVLLLSSRRPEARGAILGLHSSATYLSVFSGPLVLGVAYARMGFDAVTLVASILLVGAALLVLGARHRAVSVTAVHSRSAETRPAVRESSK
ncbi:MAG: MFS transporter [Gammaproteobacteria bacterium]|nr:MFS transporter [Gammaproteobacteria bacterium]